MYDLPTRDPADLQHAMPEIPDLLREIYAPLPHCLQPGDAGAGGTVPQICGIAAARGCG